MKWQANPESLKPRHFEINEDPSAGFYLYVFENDKCIYDHLQDTLEIAIESAWEDYVVPINSWENQPMTLQENNIQKDISILELMTLKITKYFNKSIYISELI